MNYCWWIESDTAFKTLTPHSPPCTMSSAHCCSTPPMRGGWGRQRPDPKEGKQGARRMRPDPPLQVGLRATMGRAHDLRRERTNRNRHFPRPPSSVLRTMLSSPERSRVGCSWRELLFSSTPSSSPCSPPSSGGSPIDPSSPDWSYFTDQVWGKFIASADDDSSLLLLARLVGLDRCAEIPGRSSRWLHGIGGLKFSFESYLAFEPL